jgi:hypothetical protein
LNACGFEEFPHQGNDTTVLFYTIIGTTISHFQTDNLIQPDKENTMHKNLLHRWQMTELPFSALVLFILVWFTYGILLKAPYSGFDFNANNKQVAQIFIQPAQGPSLQTDDVLVKIGPVSLAEYRKNGRQSLFENNKAGEIVDIIVIRNGAELTIPWGFPGFNQAEFNARFFNIWGLAYIFWLFGAAVQLLIRPKDGRWRLFITANYLTALWLIFGSLSAWHLWESSILLHAVTWLLLPVYLHFHWVFPRPLKELPKAAWMLFYLAGFSFAIAEITQSLPRNWYALAFLVTLLGSITLEGVHFVRQTDQRRDVFLLAISIFIAFVPTIGLGFLVMAGTAPYIGPVALFALPFMPLAYFYVIYRRQLGGMEVRVNRFISIYAFLILFGTAMVMLVIPIASLNFPLETWIILGIVFILFTVYSTIIVFPAFQAFVEKRFFGIKLPSQNLAETYSARITTSATQSSLLKLLEEDVFPSLLVRQYAFVRITNPLAQIMLSKGIAQNQVPQDAMMELIASFQTDGLPLLSKEDQPLGWVRLILPLNLGPNLIGVWLLGRRDPDDFYPQAELPILQSLANQTAIALSNILQTERLQKLYEDDIKRNEKSRLQLALDLHDSVLNQLAVLRLSVDDSYISETFCGAYDEVTRRLREIVTDLRPPMLSYGLKLAIEALADNLMERSKDTVNVVTDLQIEDEVRYAENIEQHLFRIVQEACENALRHAHATNIRISGLLNPQKIILKIQDDGTGFDVGEQLELDTLLANNHFGLAGIVERAHLIGGEVNISSMLKTGTNIQITWNHNPEEN